MKVLILSCNTGGGHNSCAKYIEEELNSNNIECEFKDFFDIVNPKLKDMASKIYLASLKQNGKFFKGAYFLGEKYSDTGITSPVYLVNKLHACKLEEYIRDNKFDLVINTHLFPSLTLTAINKDREDKVKYITIATDYEPCPFMEESKPDMLVIPRDLEDKFIKKGNSKEIIKSIGIPISSRFVDSARNIRKELGLDIKDKIVLIMLGSMGFGNIFELLNELENENYKIIVVCGNNNKLLEDIRDRNYKNIISLGFINNINDYIYTSDVVISKPGGLSSTEIAALRKPLIHMFPIPGIETYNVNYFRSHNMSLNASNVWEVKEQIRKLLDNIELREEIINNQIKYINDKSGRDLVLLIKNSF